MARGLEVFYQGCSGDSRGNPQPPGRVGPPSNVKMFLYLSKLYCAVVGCLAEVQVRDLGRFRNVPVLNRVRFTTPSNVPLQKRRS